MAGLLDRLKMPRPLYEALDDVGRPLWRQAKVIHELEHQDRRAALDSAANEIRARVGMELVAPVRFGLPVFTAFGMTKAQAERHEHSSVLLVAGTGISLDWCKDYEHA